MKRYLYQSLYISREKNPWKKYTLSQYLGRDSLNHRRKCQVFKKLSWVRPRSKLSIKDDMKIHQGKLTNILRSLENINTWLHPKHRNGWIRFKYQKNLMKCCIIKASNIWTINTRILQLKITFTQRVTINRPTVSYTIWETNRYVKQLTLPGT